MPDFEGGGGHSPSRKRELEPNFSATKFRVNANLSEVVAMYFISTT